MKTGTKTPFIAIAMLLISVSLKAQKTGTVKSNTPADSLMNAIDGTPKGEPVIATFKSTRLVLSQTTETVKKGNLNFQIIHRFGDIAGKDGGAQPLYGLDDVNDVYFGFEYGVTDNLNVDFGRSTIGGLLNLELKYALLHQTSDNSVPVAVTLLGEWDTRPFGSFTSYSSRLSYLGQVIIARKFSSFLSVQVSPSFVRNNTPLPLGNEQQFLAMQAAARVKLTAHTGFIIDYAHSFSSFKQAQDPLGFGYEIETGGHVFTVNITNARAIQEINYLSNSDASYGKGQYRLGFTISRMFDLSGHKDKGYNQE
jgi:hypothetical protein